MFGGKGDLADVIVKGLEMAGCPGLSGQLNAISSENRRRGQRKRWRFEDGNRGWSEVTVDFEDKGSECKPQKEGSCMQRARNPQSLKKEHCPTIP
jgi:hypothetical protein